MVWKIMNDQYLIAFATVPGIGPARLKILIDFFGSAQKAWEAGEEELVKTGLPGNVLAELLNQKKKLNIQQYVQNFHNRGISFITIDDTDYPERLKNIPDPPLVLFVKSQLTNPHFNQLTQGKIIGIVGTRKITSYGQEVTEMLTADLVNSGFVTVSGMALGVDGVVHNTTIENKGKTIAVLGAGVDIIYPPAHRDLYNSILSSGGAVVSEVAPEKMVGRGIFPARNRIISGLSEALLVTEGAIDSGSLITARAALEQGREVFAVPGPINSAMAEGTNYLLKQGAKLVTGVNDILESLGYDTSNTNKANKGSNTINTIKGDTPEEQKIIDLLKLEAMGFDELAKKSGISSNKLGSTLSVMEMKKIIYFGDRGYYLR